MNDINIGTSDKIGGKQQLFIISAMGMYFVMSFPINIMGANAPVMMEYYGINATQQGLIITVQSIGQLCVAFIVSLIGEKYNKIYGTAVGYLVLCLGCVAMGFGPVYSLLLVCALAVGVGVAIIDVMVNGMVPDVFPKHKNTLLPFLHGFFGAGAMLTPVLVTFTVNPLMPESFSQPFRVLGIATAVVLLFFYISGRRINRETVYRDMDAMRKRASENPAEIFKTKKAWLFLLVGFLYFTFQMGMIAWLPTYTIESTGAAFSIGGLMLTAFFAGALPMRFLGPLFLRRFSAHVFYSRFGCIAAVLMLGAIFADSLPLMFVLVVASGFLQGSLVAVFILMCTEAFPTRTASASSLFSISCSIGFITTPIWMGSMSEITGFQLPMILVCCSLFASSFLVFLKGR